MRSFAILLMKSWVIKVCGGWILWPDCGISVCFWKLLSQAVLNSPQSRLRSPWRETSSTARPSSETTSVKDPTENIETYQGLQRVLKATPRSPREIDLLQLTVH